MIKGAPRFRRRLLRSRRRHARGLDRGVRDRGAGPRCRASRRCRGTRRDAWQHAVRSGHRLGLTASRPARPRRWPARLALLGRRRQARPLPPDCSVPLPAGLGRAALTPGPPRPSAGPLGGWVRLRFLGASRLVWPLARVLGLVPGRPPLRSAVWGLWPAFAPLSPLSPHPEEGREGTGTPRGQENGGQRPAGDRGQAGARRDRDRREARSRSRTHPPTQRPGGEAGGTQS